MFKLNKFKIIFLFLFVVIILLGFVYIRYIWNNSLATASSQALKVARSAEAVFPKDAVNKLDINLTDLEKKEYQHVKNNLLNIIKIDNNIRFAWIYTQKEGKIYIIADSEPIGSKDYSPPGQEYPEATDEFRKPFEDGNFLVSQPTTDRWGTWVSVLVPMKDLETGEIKSVFAMDYPADKWNDEAILNTAQAGIIVFALLLLTITFYILARNNKKIKESEKKYQLLVENSHDIIYTLTLDGRFTFVSSAWTILLKHPLSQVIGKSFQDFVHPDDLERCMEFIKKIVETRQRQEGIEYRVRDVNNSWFWHTSSAVPLIDRSDKVVGFYGIARDITEQKKTKEKFEKMLDETTKLNQLMVGRELKMVELKGELSKYKNKQDENKN